MAKKKSLLGPQWALWLIRRSPASASSSRSAEADKGDAADSVSPKYRRCWILSRDTSAERPGGIQSSSIPLPTRYNWCIQISTAHPLTAESLFLPLLVSPLPTKAYDCGSVALLLWARMLLGVCSRQSQVSALSLNQPLRAPVPSTLSARIQSHTEYSFQNCWRLVVPACPPDPNPGHQVHGYDELSRHLVASLPVAGKHILVHAPPI
ncbi:hypothetical protein V8C34DRAFT_114821 [Trichoderma compactum]